MDKSTLTDVVRHEVDQYAGESLNAEIYPIYDELRQTYTVISIGHNRISEPAHPVVMTRIAGDYVVIEVDNTNKPLVEALEDRGVPRQQVILAYAGEKAPAT